ncbi:MAG TPA: xyloglucanase, partial [Trebonia sp.]
IGGAYRWDTDHWTPLTDWLSDGNLLGCESIAPDPTNANRVYAAMGGYTQSWAGNGVILRSPDQGRTWRRAEMPFKMGGNEDGRSAGERLVVDPHLPRVLLFGSRKNGLWRSTDAGATWDAVGSFPVPGDDKGIGVTFEVFDTNRGAAGRPTPTIYVGVADAPAALYRSTDAGATWAPVPGQPAGMVPEHGVLTPNGSLYLTYGNAPGPNGMSDGAVWKYDTLASAWADISPVKPASAGGFGYAGLAVDAQHPRTVMAATMDWWGHHDDIFRSTDGGAHWASLGDHSTRDASVSPWIGGGSTIDSLGHWIAALAIDPFQSGHVLYGTGATIWGAQDVTAMDAGQTTHWAVAARGLEETAVIALVSPPAGPHLISAVGDIGGFRHDDLTVSPRAGNFTNPTFGSTTGLDFAEQSPGVVVRVGNAWSGNRPGAVSTDGAASWTAFGAEPAGSKGGGSVAVSADGRAIVWTPQDGTPSFSHDRGGTWQACGGLGKGIDVVSDRVSPATFYAYDPKSAALYTSKDGGAHFTARTLSVSGGQGRV